MNFKKYTIRFIVLILLVFTYCKYVESNSNRIINPEVQKAIEYIGQVKWRERIEELKPLISELKTEQTIERLAIDETEGAIFAIYSGRILDAKFNHQNLKIEDFDNFKWSSVEIERINSMISKCLENKVCGYDLRYLPSELHIYIKPNIYMIFLSDKESQSARRYLELKAEKRYDARGDYFQKIAKDIFIATMRR